MSFEYLAGHLIFVGLKVAVLDDLAGGRLPIGFSLAVIASAVVAAIVLSLLFPRTPGELPSDGADRAGHWSSAWRLPPYVARASRLPPGRARHFWRTRALQRSGRSGFTSPAFAMGFAGGCCCAPNGRESALYRQSRSRVNWVTMTWRGSPIIERRASYR